MRFAPLLLGIGLLGLGTVLAAEAPPRLDTDLVLRLLADLDDDTYAVRQQADDQLRSLGPRVLPWLQDEYERNPSLEVRDRVRRMIRDLEKAAPAPHSRTR